MKTLAAVLALNLLSWSAMAATIEPSAPRVCETKAPGFTPTMVELYTSEGCDSCPPADRWLAQWPGGEGELKVIPLAFHVSYWDALGWRDPFAHADFDARHNQMAWASGGRRLYTPQVFVDGSEALDWRKPAAFAQRAQAAGARPAGARLAARWQLVGDTLELQLAGTLAKGSARLELAVVESGLETAVERGENAGKRLRHDHVVRLWRELGPLQSGDFETTERLVLPAGVRPEQARLVAWIAGTGPGAVRAALTAALHCT